MGNMRIDKKLFIELYNLGKNDYEIAELMKIGERTAQRYAQRLRKKGTIKPRMDLNLRNKVGSRDIDSEQIREVIKSAKQEWTIPKSKIIKPTNKGFKKYLYVADNHVPEHDIPAHKAIFKLMEDVNFDGFRVVGDFMDMSPISHWNKNKKKTLETQRLKEHYAIGNVLLDEFDKRLPKNCDKAYFWGNHEDWYKGLIEEMPVLEGLISPTTELNLKERGYKVYEDTNYIERIGRLSVTHGIYATIYAVRRHIQSFMTNVLFFHTHTIASRTELSSAKEISIVGYNGGCLCNRAPAYGKNRPNRWEHGFVIVYYLPNGYFYVDNIRIIKGKFVYNGVLYDGNEK